MNVTIGTPPQPVTLQIDTGSTDLWVLTPLACTLALHDPNTQGNITNCGGTYDIGKSSTGHFIRGGEGQFQATYEDGTGAQMGDYISDTVNLGNWALQDYTFGQATQADTVPGLIGMAFDTLEAGVAQSAAVSDPSQGQDSQDSNAYPAVLSSLLDAGFIKTRSFSLWLDDLDQNTGTVLFGGFDTAKIAGGKLAMLPMQNDSQTNTVDRYNVALTSIGLTYAGNGGTKSTVMTPDNYDVVANLDSGTSLTMVPNNVVSMVAAALGAKFDDVAQSYVADCSMALTPGSLDFQFGGVGGPVVGVPFSELILPFVDAVSGNLITTKNGRGLCQLGLMGQDDVTTAYEGLVLGDTFLRSAYVYYNLDTLSIGIGQTADQATGSSVQEVSNNSTLPQGATSIASTITVPSPTATPPTTSSELQGYETATAITASPATTFDMNQISGQPTSYSTSLPTALGTPGPRVSAEVKGGTGVGPNPQKQGAATGLRTLGSATVVCFAAVAGAALLL